MVSENKFKHITDKREKVRRGLYNDDIASKLIDHMTIKDAGKFLKAVRLMDPSADLNRWNDWDEKTSAGVNLAHKKKEHYANKLSSGFRKKPMDWPKYTDPKLTKITEVYRLMKDFGHKPTPIWTRDLSKDDQDLVSLYGYVYNLMAVALHHGKRALFYDLLRYHNKHTIWNFDALKLFYQFTGFVADGNSYVKNNIDIIFSLANTEQKKSIVKYTFSEIIDPEIGLVGTEEEADPSDPSVLEWWRKHNRYKMLIAHRVFTLAKNDNIISNSQYDKYVRRVTRVETQLRNRNWI